MPDLSALLWMRTVVAVAAVFGVSAGVLAGDDSESADLRGNWHQWRGPLGTGVAPEADPPVEWSEEKNVRWKTALPGKGHSTPIVWGDRVFVTTAVPYGKTLAPRYSGRPGAHDNLPVTQRHKFVALALDRKSGFFIALLRSSGAGGRETAAFAPL